VSRREDRRDEAIQSCAERAASVVLPPFLTLSKAFTLF
jgi:hypothetical protein